MGLKVFMDVGCWKLDMGYMGGCNGVANGVVVGGIGGRFIINGAFSSGLVVGQ